MAFWLYGLLNINLNGIATDFKDIDDTKIFTPFMDKTPIAYVNCKKESGGSIITNYKLPEHIDRYKDFLRDQILLLEPDIIICGGGSGLIRNFIEQNVFTGLQKVNAWMYYDEKKVQTYSRFFSSELSFSFIRRALYKNDGSIS